MTYNVCFRTNTSIPIEAFTTFGINTKPNSDNPLGKFGTGLKYAVSVILRLGGTIQVFIEGVEYVFYTSPTKFRDKEFDLVRMKKRRGLLPASWTYQKLPFTTELGKEWHLWQAYRELMSNTLDEGGEEYWVGDDYVVQDTGTYIIVSCDGLKEIVEEEESPVFLPHVTGEEGPELLYSDSFVEIYDSPSDHLYFRGVRCYDTRNKTRLTYNFLTQVELSEDRSIKNIWWIEHLLCGVIRGLGDTELLERILEEHEHQELYETHDLQLHDQQKEGSTFDSVVKQLHSAGTLGRSSLMYYNAYLKESNTSSDNVHVSVTFTIGYWKDIIRGLKEAGYNVRAEHIKVRINQQGYFFTEDE